MCLSDDLTDALSRFSAASDDDKIEKFEASTIALILKQMGAKPQFIKRSQAELELEFNCAWFNSLDLIPCQLAITRFFNFSMNEMFEKPRKSPVVADFLTRKPKTTEPFMLVFKAYDYGRMIATDLKLGDLTHIHVAIPGETSVNITLFNGFFTERCGNAAEDLE